MDITVYEMCKITKKTLEYVCTPFGVHLSTRYKQVLLVF